MKRTKARKRFIKRFIKSITRNKKLVTASRFTAGVLLLSVIALFASIIISFIHESGKLNINRIAESEEQGTRIPDTASPEPFSGEDSASKKGNAAGTVPESHERQEELSFGSLSIVIDDVGNNLEELLPFLRLPGNISFAVLPGLEHSEEAASLIREAGKDVLLHLPMEAQNGNPMGPGGISVSDDPKRIEKILSEDLRSVPGAIGINNHMGSMATSDISTMSSLFSAMQEKNLFFLDSRTTPDSKAEELGPLFGIRVVTRNIFLDNETTHDYIRSQFEKGLAIAKETGSCVFIGHVQNEATCETLAELLPEIIKNSYTLIGLKKLAGVTKT